MGILVAGLLIFFAVHSVSIFNEPWRDSMVAKLGEWRWKGVYSLLAIIGLVLIVWGYSLARIDPVILYSPPTWLRWSVAEIGDDHMTDGQIGLC